MSNDNVEIFIRQAEKSFTEFFTEYYRQNNRLKSICYSEMDDENGFYATADWGDFIQHYCCYVGGVWGLGHSMTVNACFEAYCGGAKFLCHFTDIFNALDSDELDGYSFTNCVTDGDIKNALRGITVATERYYSDIVAVLQSPSLIEDIAEEYRYEDENGIGYLDTVEETYEPYYAAGFDNEIYSYYRNILKRGKKGTLEDAFEKRVYREIKDLSKSELKARAKDGTKQGRRTFLQRFFLVFPVVLFGLIFAAVFGALGAKLDAYLFPDWLGRQADTPFAFGIIGFCIGIAFTDLIERPFYKLVVPKDKYDEFMLIFESENATGCTQKVMYIFLVIVCLFCFTFFAFDGMGVTADGRILNKDTAFSAVEEYALKDTEIALITEEYAAPAYAFKLNGEWEEFGIADEASDAVIQQYGDHIIRVESFSDLKD